MTSNDVTPPKRIVREQTWQTLIEFSLSTEPGREDLALGQVVEAVQRLNWPATDLERLKLAFVTAARNMVERRRLHGSKMLLLIRVLIPEASEAIEKAGQVDNEPVQGQISEEAAQPAGRPSARGWGFFLVQKQGHRSQDANGELHQIIELFLYQENH